MTQHLTTLLDLTVDDVERIFELSLELKSGWKRGQREAHLAGQVLTQVFEKPSLRTRNSFEAAIIQLGGGGIFLTTKEAGLQGRESLSDVARVLSSYSDFVILRTFSPTLIQEFARLSSCPVVNALSDDRHPCQALTDLLTIREEFGDDARPHMAFVGDGNNVAASLAIISAMLGYSLTVSAPPGYELDESFIEELENRFPGHQVAQERNPRRAVRDADIVYTDVWASMGQESEAQERQLTFADYQVNSGLLQEAPAHCRFMHDLPARRGMEVTDEVMESDQSIVFQQAENRMHLAKGLLVWLNETSQQGDSVRGGSPTTLTPH